MLDLSFPNSKALPDHLVIICNYQSLIVWSSPLRISLRLTDSLTLLAQARTGIALAPMKLSGPEARDVLSEKVTHSAPARGLLNEHLLAVYDKGPRAFQEPRHRQNCVGI